MWYDGHGDDDDDDDDDDLSQFAVVMRRYKFHDICLRLQQVFHAGQWPSASLCFVIHRSFARIVLAVLPDPACAEPPALPHFCRISLTLAGWILFDLVDDFFLRAFVSDVALVSLPERARDSNVSQEAGTLVPGSCAMSLSSARF